MAIEEEAEDKKNPDDASDDVSTPPAERSAGRLDRMVDFIESSVRLIAYFCALVIWFAAGLMVWLPSVILSVIVILIVMTFKLIVGWGVEPEARRFSKIISFWPNGFSILKNSFWKQIQIESDDSAPDETSYFVVGIRILGLFLLTFLGYCIWNQIDPVQFVQEKGRGFWIPSSIAVVIAFGLMGLSDWRRRTLIKRKEDSAGVERNPSGEF